MDVQELTLGPLRARVVNPSGGESGTGSVVVFMHGFGAPGTDLVPLARELRAPSGTRFVFPEAPIQLPPPIPGRAWWMIDVVAMQQALASGTLRDLSKDDPEGLQGAREQVVAMIEAIHTQLRPSHLVLGGFSQGAMLATDVTLRTSVALAGLILFSPTVIAERVWAPLFSKRKGLDVVITHGRYDPILPFMGSEHLKSLFEAGGAKVNFVAFDGMHELPKPALDAASALLSRQLPDD